MIRLLFLGAFPPASLVQESNGRIDSLYRSGEAVISGFRRNKGVDISVITSPDIASFPKQRIFFRGFYDTQCDAYMVSSLNLPIIKQIWTIAAMTLRACKTIRKYKGETVIVMLPYMVFRHTSAGRLLQLLFRDRIKIALIIPDIFFSKKIITRVYYKLAECQAKNFDYFILYTQAMGEYLKISDKPNVVIEGFYEIKPHRIIKPQEKFIVTYTGSLNICYGIERLIDAMSYIQNEDLELHLYGDGDGVEYIKENSCCDERIKFFGRVDKKTAVEALYRSSALVNPRNATDGAYVQYSFPSKDIDYLSTGIISILCKLPGMPSEYYGHFVDAGDGTPKDLAEAIVKTYQMSIEERNAIAQKAKTFIEDRMDCTNQTEKILNLINHN